MVRTTAIHYKIDILSELKSAGYSTYRLRKDKIFGESTIQRFRNGGVLDLSVIDKLCTLLHYQIGDIVEYVPDNKKEG